MTQISEPQAFELIRRLLQSADDYEADMILCMCPMCQLNLDGYQGRVNGYFGTEFQAADHVLHADAGHRLRPRAEEARLRQGTGVGHAGVEEQAQRATGGSIVGIRDWLVRSGTPCLTAESGR